MRSLAFVCLFLVLCTSGCTSRRARAYSVLPESIGNQEVMARAQATLSQLYPAQYRATQRAILTIGRRQYVTEGVLEVSPQTGHHLVVLSTLGLVTEVQVDTNGFTRVLRVTPLFNEAWSRRFVARDLRLLFIVPQDRVNAGRLADGRFVVQNEPTADGTVTRYIFNATGDRLEEVEVARGKRRDYHASVQHYRSFPGVAGTMPAEFQVSAPAYRLELRTAEVTRSVSRANASAAGSTR